MCTLPLIKKKKKKKRNMRIFDFFFFPIYIYIYDIIKTYYSFIFENSKIFKKFKYFV